MANNKEERLKGVDKAAILLMYLGDELAGEVCKHLSQEEIQVLGSTIVKKDSVSHQTSKQIVKEFVDALKSGDSMVEGLEFAKSLITKALGPERARDIIDQLTRDAGKGGIDALKWMDPAVVANIIKNEHPQIIALILIHLDPVRAAHVLMNIPEERLRGEIMLRVATLKRVPSAALKDLERLIKDQMLNAGGSEGSAVEGVKVAAEILNSFESKNEGGIMDVIEKASPDLAIKIQEMMFMFSDLLLISDRGIQLIIKEINTDLLAMALKGTEDALKDKFLKNMSERAAEMLAEDMEAKGPVKVIDVEKAQQEIIKIARRLEQEGKIVRAGKGGDVVI